MTSNADKYFGFSHKGDVIYGAFLQQFPKKIVAKPIKLSFAWLRIVCNIAYKCHTGFYSFIGNSQSAVKGPQNILFPERPSQYIIKPFLRTVLQESVHFTFPPLKSMDICAKFHIVWLSFLTLVYFFSGGM